MTSLLPAFPELNSKALSTFWPFPSPMLPSLLPAGMGVTPMALSGEIEVLDALLTVPFPPFMPIMEGAEDDDERLGDERAEALFE